MENENFFTNIPICILPVLVKKLPNGNYVKSEILDSQRVLCRLPNSRIKDSTEMISPKEISNILKNMKLKEY